MEMAMAGAERVREMRYKKMCEISLTCTTQYAIIHSCEISSRFGCFADEIEIIACLGDFGNGTRKSGSQSGQAFLFGGKIKNKRRRKK